MSNEIKILKVKRISKDAILPNYAHESDVGLDLYSIERKVIPPGKSCLIRTGLIIELPEGAEAQVRPRSSLALKHTITILNSPGTVDPGYRGEIKVIMINHGENDFLVEKKLKVAQLVISPIIKVNVLPTDELSSTDREEKGFGSTGLYLKGKDEEN
jgi:dUTP pyrophosphatase